MARDLAPRDLLLSAGLHTLVLAAVLLQHPPPPPEPGEPARIEVVFDWTGALPPVPSAAAPARPAHPARPAEPGPGEPLLAAAPSPASPAVPRLGDPAAGLRFQQRTGQMLPAHGVAGNRGPDYPAAAARLHQTGTVLLRLYIGTDGAVTRVETLRSSGVAALDAAATTALARWHFLPAERDGKPVESYWDQPVVFGPGSGAGVSW